MSYISNSLKNKESWTYFQYHQSDSECIILLSRNGQRDFFVSKDLKHFLRLKGADRFPEAGNVWPKMLSLRWESL